LKFDRHSIGVKLLTYFTLFAAAILCLLWLLQTVLLQSLYEGMMTRELERVAAELAAARDATDFEALLDRAAYDNSILVYVIDEDGVVVYTTDEHMGARRMGGRAGRMGNGMGMGGMMGGLPSDYAEFSEQMRQSADGQVRYTLNSGSGAKTLVLGVRLDDALLYISTPLDPLGVTIEILRRQLLYVSIVALLMGLVIAFFIARRFTRPVTAITSQAGALAEGRFPESFDKGFCSELDHLSDTLTYASRELGKVEGLRRELIANVSHDLKTPLTLIKAYAELIRDISGDNKAKREAHLGVISSEVDRLEKLVSDILSLSQAQSGSMPLDMEALDIGETVARVMARFEPLFTSEGYQFHAEIEPDQTAQADARRIEQVLYNLIGNAMNYIGGDKTVYVRVKGNSDAVRVEISDRGEGIAEEDLPRIWERYYKAKDHVRDKAGTGLGLSIVKGILETHRARFGVKSRTGEGSTFWFELRR
jgi:signal transduction histidine kinase